MRPGTTNVDYSWQLYENFQSLRSYRETRFRVDPAGFDVATQGTQGYREEKIDLPAGWLRGFMQIQGGDGAADAAGVAFARRGLFGPGLDETAPAADQPARNAL